MKKVIMYGSPLCGPCREAKEILDASGIHYGYIEITAQLGGLKRFLELRDTRPEFEPSKKEGKVGIPCIVVDDETFYFKLPENLDVLR